MASRNVLIVDDSKVAGVTLGRVLEQHGLTVELAESGQDCLDYLRRNIPPGVIFLDHMMPGMDGFDVLRAIKADAPTTAIPVIMYTSKDGQAYMGEAIALGAYDVLSKPIKVIDLLRILRRLGMIDEDPSMRPARAAPPSVPRTEAASSAGTSPTTSHAAAAETGPLGSLFDRQRQALRQDLAEGLESIAERFGPRANGARPSGSPRLSGLTRWQLAAYAALLLVPVLWSISLYRISAPVPAAASGLAVEAPARRTAPANELQASLLLDMVGWAANLSGQYDYHRMPLDDARLQVLREMLMRLSLANFRGTVRIDTHVGDFCLVRGQTGELLLPTDDVPKDKCEFLNLAPEQYVALGRRQTAAFAGFLQNSSLTNNDVVNVQVVSHGRSRPFVEYPIFSNIQTAGEWNRAARLNNRVEFTLIPRETVAASRQ